MRPFTRPLLFILLLALLSTACFLEDEALATPASVSSTAANDWYSIYFTDPNADYYEGGPDEALVKAIDDAKVSVDMAIYDLDLDSVKAALLRAHQRGVTVRLVTESDYMDEAAIQELLDAGLEVLGDRREGYMHNKFTVIDHLEVWGGSMNYTTNDAYRNNNNLIRIRSARLAEDYTTEFNEMFEEDLFGPDDRPATPNPLVTVNGTQIEVYFSPDDGVADHLVELLRSAEHSIYFLAFSFTSDDLAEAILERAEAGVSVAGVMEAAQYASNVGSEFDAFQDAGLEVYLDANPRNMHAKVFIIDEQIVVTGSYNFSANAEQRNDENVMVIHNAQIAAQYLAEFQQILALAKK
jgi:phosphatidylserine/phosphatidylglycerophosphate/cardiolipin synthase-like enzyme